MHIKALLSDALEAAFQTLGLAGPALVQTSSRPELGDYQANGIMAAAKRAKRNPREVAAEVINQLDLSGVASKVDIAGPGFLNITLSAEFLAGVRAGQVTASPSPERVVVDYSAPNLAKEMHVGHLRSTIIGDCMVRVLEAQGHTVIRQNHVGDWGTQFGMLLTYLQDNNANSDSLAYLEDFYRAAKTRFDEDPDFQQRARQAVVDLQAGDAQTLAMWQHFINVSMSHCQEIYDRLDVTLQPAHIHGESAYNDALPGIIRQLDAKGLLSVSEGAQCVFLDEFKTRKGEILPVIVQKSDGGYLYATTDLAAIQYRNRELNAQRVLYFTDARQALHFKQIFAVARHAGLADSDMSLEHMPFGAMLGDDGKPFKTRAGTVVKLADLLDEAELRATRLVRSKNPELSEAAAAQLGHVIGIGAVKYADLSKNRTSDYVFNWEQMISFDGNTSPYLQYAYTRIASIFARGKIDPERLPAQTTAVEEPERRLAVMIAGFNDTLEAVAEEGMPHLLCGYLYELATRFTSFYEACPILNSSEDVRERRLVLARQTADTLRTGLDLLGIGVVDQM
ncbi:MAG: arginine--tRNA ligase [bacterium]